MKELAPRVLPASAGLILAIASTSHPTIPVLPASAGLILYRKDGWEKPLSVLPASAGLIPAVLAYTSSWG